jgi:hypothetical protein
LAIEDKTVVLTVKSVTDGVDQSTAAIQREGDVIAQTQTRIETRSLSLERAAQKYNDLYRVEQTYAANQVALQRAMDTYIQKTGDTTKAQELYGLALDGLNQKHSATASRLSALGAGMGTVQGASSETATALGMLGAETEKTGIKSNQMREAMVLVHEMLSGNYKRAVGSATIELQNLGLMAPIVTAAMSPLGLAIITLTAGTVLAVASNYAHHESIKAVADAYKLQGGAVGLSRSELESYAQTVGMAGDISVKEMRSIEAAALSAAQVPADALKTISAMAQDYAKAFDGGDLVKAATDLAQAYKDPIAGAQKLDDQFNILSDSQKQQISELTAMGDKLGAFNVLTDAVKDRTKDLADHGVGYLGKGWHGLANEISNAWDALGKWGSGDTIAEKLDSATKKLNDLKAALAQSQANSAYDPYNSQGEQVKLAKQIAAQQSQVDAEQQKAAAEAAKAAMDAEAAAMRELGKQAGDVARGYDTNGTAAKKVKDDIVLLTKAFMDGQLSADLYAKSLAQAQTQLVDLQNPTAKEIANLENMAATADLLSLAQQNARAKYSINARTDITQPQKDALYGATLTSNNAASAAGNQNTIDTLDVQTEAQDRLTAAVGRGWLAEQQAINVNTVAAAVADGGIVKTKQYADSLADATIAKQHFIDVSISDKLQQELTIATMTAAAHQDGAVAVANLTVSLGGYQDALAGVSPKQQAANDALRQQIALQNEVSAAGDYMQNLKEETAIEQKTLDVLKEKKGERTDEIEQLKLRLDIEKQFPLLSDDERQKLINQADQLAKIKGQTQDQTKAYDDQQKALKSISDGISRDMATGLEAAFKGGGDAWTKMLQTWHTGLDSFIANMISQFATTHIIMPIVESIVGVTSSGNSTNSGSAGGFGTLLGLAGTGSNVSQALGGQTLGQTLGLTGANGALTGASSYLFGTAGTTATQLAGDAYIPTAAEELAATGTEATSGAIGSGGLGASLSAVGPFAGAAALGGLAGYGIGTASQSPVIGGLGGAAAGALIGAAIVGPLGAAVGGIAGAIAGALSGEKPSVGPNSGGYVSYKNGVASVGIEASDNGGNDQVAIEMQKAAVAAFNNLNATAGGPISGVPDLRVGTFNGKYFGTTDTSGGTAANATYANEADAVANAVLMALKQSDLGNITQGTDAATISSDLTFAEQFSAVIASWKSGVIDYTQAAQVAAETTSAQLVTSMQNFNAQAKALGLSTTDATTAEKSAVESLLGLTNVQPISAMEQAVQTLYGKLEGVSGLLTQVGIDQETATSKVKDQVLQMVGITTAIPTNAIANEVAGIKQTFADLGSTFQALGITADQVAQGLQANIALIQTAVTADLTTRNNSAQGLGILNTLATAIAQQTTDLQSANAAGLGSNGQNLANDVFNNTVFSALNQLAGNTTALNAVINQYSGDTSAAGKLIEAAAQQVKTLGAVAGTVAVNVSTMQSAFTTAQSAYVTALNTQITTTQSLISAMQGLTQTANSNLLGANSDLSPQAKLSAAQGIYQTDLSSLQSGTLTGAALATALQSFGTDATNYETQAKAYYGSSAADASIFNSVQGSLTSLGSGTGYNAATGSLTGLQSELAAAQALGSTAPASDDLGALKTAMITAFNSLQIAVGGTTVAVSGVDSRVQSANQISGNIATSASQTVGYTSSTAGNTNSTATNTGGTTSAISGVTTSLAQSGALGQLIYSMTNILHNDLQAIGSFTYNTAVYAGKITYSTAQTAGRLGGIGVYAGGTMNAPGGLSMVGELSDPGAEILNIPKGGQVFNMRQVASLFGGSAGNDNGASSDMLSGIRSDNRYAYASFARGQDAQSQLLAQMVSEIQALRSEISRSRHMSLVA